MTHEKAVDLAHHAMVNSKSRAHGLIDALVALEVLSFEEKLSAEANMRSRLSMALLESIGLGPYYIDQFHNALAKAGLKLVEK